MLKRCVRETGGSPVIHCQEQFVTRWLEGLKESALEDGVVAYLSLWKKIKKHKKFREYVVLFLRRSYLKHFDELSKNRPVNRPDFHGGRLV